MENDKEVKWRLELQQFTPNQLMIIKDMMIELRDHYEAALWQIAQSAIFERLKVTKDVAIKIDSLEVELAHQEKEIEENFGHR